jgi:hypothetical protein
VWIRLASENQPETLVILMWSWLIHLKVPILSNEELSQIVVYFDAPDVCFSKFDQVTLGVNAVTKWTKFTSFSSKIV